jgi:hypothetical protein
MSDFDHGVCVVFVLVCGLANLGLAMENNDSRLMSVPKEEFVRVMTEIVSSGERGLNAPNSEDADRIYAVAYADHDKDKNA